MNNKKERTIERIQVKASLGLTLPKPQVVSRLGLVTRNHDIISDCQNFLTASPDRTATVIRKALCLTVEPHFIGNIKTGQLSSYMRGYQLESK